MRKQLIDIHCKKYFFIKYFLQKYTRDDINVKNKAVSVFIVTLPIVRRMDLRVLKRESNIS